MIIVKPHIRKANSLPTGNINLLIKYGIHDGAMHHTIFYYCWGFEMPVEQLLFYCRLFKHLNTESVKGTLTLLCYCQKKLLMSQWGQRAQTIHLRQTAVSLLAGFLLQRGTNSSIWKEKPHFNYACVQMRGLQCRLLCLHMHRQRSASVHFVFKDFPFMSRQALREDGKSSTNWRLFASLW